MVLSYTFYSYIQRMCWKKTGWLFVAFIKKFKVSEKFILLESGLAHFGLGITLIAIPISHFSWKIVLKLVLDAGVKRWIKNPPVWRYKNVCFSILLCTI